jgi:hypothetical protein
MHNPPRLLISPRSQAIVLGLIAIALALGGFQAGRRSVDAAAVAKTVAIEPSGPVRDFAPPRQTLFEHDQKPITVREIATVPFSELYDVLKSASHDQLLAWAHDLEQMPRGPRQRAAVAAYYKSLVQVDHHAAIEALIRAENLNMRDVAIAAVMAATPESLWGELNEMLDKLPHPRRGFFPQDLIWNWSRVDPVAVGKYIDRYPASGEDERLYALLFNWARIEPIAAKEWLEGDTSHQKKDAFRAFTVAWAEADRDAAINYAVGNSTNAEFEPAVKELAYYLLRLFPDEAKRFVLLLPPDRAKAAVNQIVHNTTSVILHAPEDYQRPPDVVARWMAALPVDLWQDAIGGVVSEWLSRDADAATIWFNQLPPDARDAAIADLCRQGWTETAEPTISLGFTIRDKGLRDHVLGDFARSLGETRDEAMAAVDKLPISPAQKKYLVQIMPEARSEN